jgi:hypothetical protein
VVQADIDKYKVQVVDLGKTFKRIGKELNGQGIRWTNQFRRKAASGNGGKVPAELILFK